MRVGPGEVAAAAKILDTDAALRDQLTGMRKESAPNQIGKHGQLQEWMEDVDDPKNEHRHVSHVRSIRSAARCSSRRERSASSIASIVSRIVAPG